MLRLERKRMTRGKVKVQFCFESDKILAEWIRKSRGKVS